MSPVTDDCATLEERGGWAEDAALKRCSPPYGPRNTWSNAAYPLAGILAGLVLHTWTAWVFALTMTVLGVCSGYYHAYKTISANRLDWFGMYAVLASLVIHGILPNGAIAGILMAVTGGSVAMYFSESIQQYDLNGQIGLLLGLCAIPAFAYGHWKLATASMLLMTFAYGIQQLDCHKSKLTGIWGHSIWHGLSGLAFLLMFLAQSR